MNDMSKAKVTAMRLAVHSGIWLLAYMSIVAGSVAATNILSFLVWLIAVVLISSVFLWLPKESSPPSCVPSWLLWASIILFMLVLVAEGWWSGYALSIAVALLMSHVAFKTRSSRMLDLQITVQRIGQALSKVPMWASDVALGLKRPGYFRTPNSITARAVGGCQ